MTPEEYQQAVYDDPLALFEGLKIRHRVANRGLVPFVLNDEQLKLFAAIWEVWTSGQPVRFIILKGRQFGVSTLLEALGYWLTSTRSDTGGLVVSHDKDSSRHILEITTRFWEKDRRHEYGLAPQRSHANRDELKFNNPDWRERAANPGLGSHLKVMTADNKSAGHSLTYQFLHCSEVARWDKPEVMNGLLPALAPGGGSMGFLESTAHGAAGVFYDTWQEAVAGRNEWTPIFLSWKGRPECRVPLMGPSRELFGNALTKGELDLQKEHGLELEELMWRRRMIASPACQGQGRDPVDVFREQYPLAPEEAFVATGRQYFDLSAVVRQEKTAREQAPEPEDGVIVLEKEGKEFRPKSVEFVVTKGGAVRVWKRPVPGRDYVLGGDVAGGLAHGDWSHAYVMDRVTQEMVARFRGKPDPLVYADRLVELAWYYNEAVLAVEANGIGFSTARKVAANYRRIVYHRQLTKMGFGEADGEKPGWYTTTSNRVQMFGLLKTAVAEGSVIIWDADFWAETRNFVVPEKDGKLEEGKPRASAHKHDDTISAACITLWCNDSALAGPIRRPKLVEQIDASWRVNALRQAVRERQKPKNYDPDTGDPL